MGVPEEQRVVALIPLEGKRWVGGERFSNASLFENRLGKVTGPFISRLVLPVDEKTNKEIWKN